MLESKNESFDVVAFSESLPKLDDDSMIEAYEDVRTQFAVAKHRYENDTFEMRTRIVAIENELIDRMRKRNATAIAHPYYEVTLEQKTQLDKNIAILRTIEAHVPEDECRKAIALVQQDPVWRADAIKLKALAKKYGGVVADIVASGMRHVPVGMPRVIVRAKDVI